VLVPAHDESDHLRPTLDNLLGQLGPGDRLLVVADNCSDDTAEQARAGGAEVVERFDTRRRGKGYALAHGIRHLAASGQPEVLVVVDADCIVSPGALAHITRLAVQHGRPVQMLDLMVSGPGANLRARILEFAWRMKNWVRPLGSARLGDACHLMGTGMALPWPLLAQVQLDHGHLAEDMALGLDLALAGHAPLFCTEVRLTSRFVADAGVARTQKARWEHGHLAAMSEQLPRLLRGAWQRRDPALAALALDLLIPPVALYTALLAALLAGLGLASPLLPVLLRPALALVLASAAAFGAAIGLAWWRCARDLVSARELLALPLYALWKLPIYLAYAVGRRSAWVRTRRGGAH
jgi:glycosyltransferase involved in cell wall biosynthesis